jgi:hypothetical protein
MTGRLPLWPLPAMMRRPERGKAKRYTLSVAKPESTTVASMPMLPPKGCGQLEPKKH